MCALPYQKIKHWSWFCPKCGTEKNYAQLVEEKVLCLMDGCVLELREKML